MNVLALKTIHKILLTLLRFKSPLNKNRTFAKQDPVTAGCSVYFDAFGYIFKLRLNDYFLLHTNNSKDLKAHSMHRLCRSGPKILYP